MYVVSWVLLCCALRLFDDVDEKGDGERDACGRTLALCCTLSGTIGLMANSRSSIMMREV